MSLVSPKLINYLEIVKKKNVTQEIKKRAREKLYITKPMNVGLLPRKKRSMIKNILVVFLIVASI